RQNNDRQVFVNQCVRTVLHFARRITFRMNVGNFLELQRPFKRDRIVDAPAQIEKIGVAKELPRQIFVETRFIRLENGFDLVRDAGEFLHQGSGGFFAELAANLAEIGSEQKQSS